MGNFLDYAKQYEVKKNPAVEAFLSAIEKQSEMLEADKANRRSWFKVEGNGYLITLGKIEGSYALPSKKDAKEFLAHAAAAARSDADFIALIDKAYGSVEEAPKRGRKRRGGDVVGNG